MIKAPATITDANVVSREKIRIALMFAALNDFRWSADILNAYVQAPATKKMWNIMGPEFGSHASMTAVIVRALYGLKSVGAAFSHHLARILEYMVFLPCWADPKLWMKPKTYPDDRI